MNYTIKLLLIYGGSLLFLITLKKIAIKKNDDILPPKGIFSCDKGYFSLINYSVILAISTLLFIGIVSFNEGYLIISLICILFFFLLIYYSKKYTSRLRIIELIIDDEKIIYTNMNNERVVIQKKEILQVKKTQGGMVLKDTKGKTIYISKFLRQREHIFSLLMQIQIENNFEKYFN